MHDLTHDTLAAIELISVPAGLCALDALCKQAQVAVLFAGDIDPGHFLVLFSGGLGDVEASLACAVQEGGADVLETLLLPQAHEALHAALRGELTDDAAADEAALGILQSHTVIGTLAAVDRALKAASLRVVRLRLATELAGQGHAVLAGPQFDVEAGLEAAQSGVPAGVVLQVRRIARPAAEVFQAASQRPRVARAVRPLDA